MNTFSLLISRFLIYWSFTPDAREVIPKPVLSGLHEDFSRVPDSSHVSKDRSGSVPVEISPRREDFVPFFNQFDLPIELH